MPCLPAHFHSSVVQSEPAVCGGLGSSLPGCPVHFMSGSRGCRVAVLCRCNLSASSGRALTPTEALEPSASSRQRPGSVRHVRFPQAQHEGAQATAAGLKIWIGEHWRTAGQGRGVITLAQDSILLDGEGGGQNTAASTDNHPIRHACSASWAGKSCTAVLDLPWSGGARWQQLGGRDLEVRDTYGVLNVLSWFGGACDLCWPQAAAALRPWQPCLTFH
jgi:hypothetical protein